MFKNRAVQVTIAKKDPTSQDERRQMDRDDILFWNAMVHNNLQTLGGGFIVLYGLKKMIDTGSTILIKMAPSG